MELELELEDVDDVDEELVADVVPEPDEVAGCWAGWVVVGVVAAAAPDVTDPVVAVEAVEEVRPMDRAGRTVPAEGDVAVSCFTVALPARAGVASGTSTSPDAGWT